MILWETFSLLAEGSLRLRGRPGPARPSQRQGCCPAVPAPPPPSERSRRLAGLLWGQVMIYAWGFR